MNEKLLEKGQTICRSIRKLAHRIIRRDVLWTCFAVVVICSESLFAQQTRVQNFFTRGTSFLTDIVAPLVALACGFWGVVNIMNERPSGKQWVGTAGFLAIRIFRDTLQGWWQ